MWLAALQLVSGRHWQDNRDQIAAELATLPEARPLLVLLPENFALFGERQGYLDGAEAIGPDLSGAAPIQQTAGRMGSRSWHLAGGRSHADPDPGL